MASIVKHPQEYLMKRLNLFETHLTKQEIHSYDTACFLAELNDLYRVGKLSDEQLNEKLKKIIHRLQNNQNRQKRILNMLVRTTQRIQNSTKIH